MVSKKKKEIPEGKVHAFKAQIDGKTVELEIGSKKIAVFNVPGFGKMTSDEALENEEALTYLIESGSSIVRLKGGEARPIIEAPKEKKGDKDLEPLGAQIAEQASEITTLKATIAERDETIEAMDDKIVSLKSTVESNDSIIKNLEDRIAELNGPARDDPKKGK